jgi:hypothetical protein
MEEQVELAGPMTTLLERKLTTIRGIADRLLVGVELAQDSHVLTKVKRIILLSTFYAESYQRRGGGPVTQ